MQAEGGESKRIMFEGLMCLCSAQFFASFPFHSLLLHLPQMKRRGICKTRYQRGVPEWLGCVRVDSIS